MIKTETINLVYVSMRVLKEGTYILQPDCLAEIKKDILVVRKKKFLWHILQPGEYRCKDCKFYSDGYAVSHYKTKVCLKKPKQIKRYPNRQYHFCVPPYGKVCDKFQLKNE